MKIIAKVPLRVSFFGGGTDIPPYCDAYGGEILYSTINRYAYCEIETNWERDVIVLGDDNEVYCDGDLQYTGKYGIVKAVLHVLKIRKGCRIRISSDVLQGTGLGGSSAQTAAVILACYGWEHKKISKKALAQQAYHIERLVLKVKGGYQDPITTVYGGIGYLRVWNIMDFNVRRLALSESEIERLKDSLILFYTGMRHNSSAIMEEHIQRQAENREQNIELMQYMKELASQAQAVLKQGDIVKLGNMLNLGWEYKKQMAGSVSGQFIDGLYDGARKAGALGGKILGAGGGGYLLLCVEEKLRQNVIDFLSEQSGKIENDWRFDFIGARLEEQL